MYRLCSWLLGIAVLAMALAGPSRAAPEGASVPPPLGEIVFTRKDGVAPEVAPAVFSHWFHRIRFKCYACHDALFEMKAGANDVTMEAILGGKYCGACHNGQTAWASTFSNCTRCHVVPGEASKDASEGQSQEPPKP